MSTMVKADCELCSVDSQTDWQWIHELLITARYDEVSELIHAAQLESERIHDTALAGALATTRQICLALAASQAEKTRHRQASEEACERERALTEQLHLILGLVGIQDTVVADHKLINIVTSSATKRTLPAPEFLQSTRSQPPWPNPQDLLEEQLRSLSSDAETSTIFSVQPFKGLATFSRQPEPELVTPDITPIEIPASPTEGMQKSKSCVLKVYCLGPFRVYQNGQLVEKWNGNKCRSLLKYLVIHRERPVLSEVLMDLLWAEADPDTARKNLHQAIFNLRQTLRNSCPDISYILLGDSSYYLNPELEVYLDSETFIQHYQNGHRLESQGYLPQAMKEYKLADSLYKGEFLAEDLYEDWTTIHRANLKETRLDLLDRLSQFYFKQEQLTLCMEFCHKLLAEDNCWEDAHRRLMHCYIRQGQRHLALRQYNLCVEMLKQELAVPPMPATVKLYRQIQGNYI